GRRLRVDLLRQESPRDGAVTYVPHIWATPKSVTRARPSRSNQRDPGSILCCTPAMDLRRTSRAPTGVARRWQAARRGRAERRFHTTLRFDPKAAPLLLSPHWDDAVLDCWALLGSPGDLAVVNVFAGTPVPGRLTRWDRVTGAVDSSVRTRERATEDAEALAQVGRGAVNLPLLDAEYRAPGPSPSLRDIDQALT